MPEVVRTGYRLLMTADTVGGVWDYSLELSRALAETGISTVLATLGRLPTPSQRKAAESIPGLVLESTDLRLEWMPDAERDVVRSGEWLLELEHAYRPDLIHLNGYAHALLPWRAPHLVVAHSCVLSWWLAVKGEPAPRPWALYADRVATALRTSPAVVFPTTALARAMEGIYGPIPRGRTIWNGRNPHRYSPRPKDRFIFSAGRLWDEGKNLTALQEIAEDLPWPVMAAGDWSMPGKDDSPPPAGLRTLGFLSPEEMTDYLGRASIYALPARYEPFGLSVLEAALCGCSLVLGDIPTFRELWGGAAIFVPPDSPEELRRRLKELCLDGEKRLELGQKARRRAHNYSTHRMISAYRHLYSELLPARNLVSQPAREEWIHPTAMKS